jgi:RIO-like serine/threonine protein kinase
MEKIHLVGIFTGMGGTISSVMKHLALRHNTKRGYAWCSNEEIAKRCDLSISSVKRSLYELEHTFKLIQRRSRGHGRSKMTIIKWDVLIANKKALIAAQLLEPV